MTEKEVKTICKWIVENSKRRLYDDEKELLKQTIDQSQNIEELAAVAIAYMNRGDNHELSRKI